MYKNYLKKNPAVHAHYKYNPYTSSLGHIGKSFGSLFNPFLLKSRVNEPRTDTVRRRSEITAEEEGKELSSSSL